MTDTSLSLIEYGCSYCNPDSDGQTAYSKASVEDAIKEYERKIQALNRQLYAISLIEEMDLSGDEDIEINIIGS